MDATAGYVYILINPSLNGIVKIGKTRNSPDERAKELSSATGVPTSFFVAYQAYFKDCDAAEIFVHTRLERARLADNREFFRVSVQKAIEAVREAESTLETLPEPDVSLDVELGVRTPQSLAPWEAIFRSANAHFYGADDTIQDYYEAFQLFLKSAKLGSISAYWKLGTMYLTGLGCSQDIQKAKNVFLDGTKVGSELCWAGLADAYYREGHVENWDKCWRKYFSSSFFTDKKQFPEYEATDVMMSHRAYQMCFYINQSIWNKWEMTQQDLIYERRGEIGAFIMWYRGNSGNEDAYNLIDEVITNLAQQFATRENNSASVLSSISDEDLKNKSPLEIFQIANHFNYDYVDDDQKMKGIYYYEKAALAGFGLAYWKLGRIYSGGYSVVADEEKAITFLEKGTELGVDLSWTELAYLFAKYEKFDEWNYFWKRYFESKTFLNNIVFDELLEFDKLKSRREYQMFFYLQQASEGQWKTPFMPILVKYRSQIRELILREATSICIGEMPINEIIELMSMTGQKSISSAEDYCQDILSKIQLV